jgi:hypothetical protein
MNRTDSRRSKHYFPLPGVILMPMGSSPAMMQQAEPGHDTEGRARP